MDCLFCKIINGEIPSTKVYEDDICYAFKDINPVAPTHILFIPKNHIDGLDELKEDEARIVSHILLKIRDVAKEMGLDDGYRVVTNIGKYGGQSVRHLHFHLIGGRQLSWEF